MIKNRLLILLFRIVIVVKNSRELLVPRLWVKVVVKVEGAEEPVLLLCAREARGLLNLSKLLVDELLLQCFHACHLLCLLQLL